MISASQEQAVEIKKLSYAIIGARIPRYGKFETRKCNGN